MTFEAVERELAEAQNKRDALRGRELQLQKRIKHLKKKNQFTKSARAEIFKELNPIRSQIFPINRRIRELKKERARLWPEHMFGDKDGKCLN